MRKEISKRKVWFVIFLTVLGMGMIVFAKVTDNYLSRENWETLDQPIITWVYNMRNPILSRLMLLITLSSNWQMIILGTIMVAILLVKAHHWRYFWVLLVTNSVAISFIELSKYIIGRERPPTAMAIISQSSYSFPSGHSYFAGVYYGLLVYFLVRHLRNREWQVFFVVAGVIWILALSFSRIYLGVHWPTDVIAGLSSGTVWLMVTIMFLEFENMLYGKKRTKIENVREFYGLMGVLGVIWTLTLGLMYSTQNINAANLGMKMEAPTRAAMTAETRTAPAARSRA